MTAEALSVEDEIIDKSSSGIQKLPMLDVLFGRIPLDIVSALKSRAGILVEADSRGVFYAPWSRLLGGMNELGVCAVAKSDPWGGNVFVCLSPELIFAALEVQMGGTPAEGSAVKRPPTAIEKRIAQRLADAVITVVAENFSRVTPVSLSIEGVDVLRQANAAMPAGSPCSACSISVSIGEAVGEITVIIPLSTLDPVQGTLSKMFLGEKLGDLTWRDHISKNITASHVDITAVMHEFGASMTDVLGWRVGDVIDIGISEVPEICLVCSDTEILFGSGGQCGDNRYAVRVDREAAHQDLSEAGLALPAFKNGFDTLEAR